MRNLFEYWLEVFAVGLVKPVQTGCNELINKLFHFGFPVPKFSVLNTEKHHWMNVWKTVFKNQCQARVFSHA